MSNWGTDSANAFIAKTHKDIYDAIDPTKVELPSPFVVCVVGASRGIGAGIATAYAKAGASGIVLASRRVTGLEQTATDCKAIKPDIKIAVVPCDITSVESVKLLANETKRHFSRLDVLAINSAFSGPCLTRITDNEPADFINATNVNYIGPFLCIKYFLPLLLSSPDGRKTIFAVSTLATLLVRGPIANIQYCVSKMAQLRMLEMVHEQYREEGLLVYNVHPGAVASEQALETAPESFVKYLEDSEELCGAFAVWLTKDDERKWLSGRLCCATWDTGELESKKDEVVTKDLLKLSLEV
jgi:NAD(P)-dependent dehydrogenase (short-subunit alcohol dehydrogenase family)